MRDVLERLLPVDRHPVSGGLRGRRCPGSMPALPNIPAMRPIPCSRATASGAPAGALPHAALERLRSRLLRQFRSLHEAFAQLQGRSYFFKVVGMSEIRAALSRVDEEACDEFLAAVGTTWPSLSLADVYDMLVGCSGEALIWEMAAALTRRGLWPVASQHALERAQKYLHDAPADVSVSVLSCGSSRGTDASWGVAAGVPLDSCDQHESSSLHSADGCDHPHALDDIRFDRRQGVESSDVTQLSAAWLPANFDRARWLRFCTFLSLTVRAAERLFEVFGNLSSDSDSVCLSLVLEAARVTVSPDMSLQRFAGKAIRGKGSLRASFGACCCEPTMRWFHFQKLAASLEVSDRRAAKLWTVIVSKSVVCSAEGDASISDAKATGAVDEDTFVYRAAFWVTAEVLDTLKVQFRSIFGSLQEARQALRRHGLPSGAALESELLGDALHSAGISSCDPDVLLLATRTVRRRWGFREGSCVDQSLLERALSDPYSRVSLDDVIDAMRSQPCAARATVAQNQVAALRRQLSDVRTAGAGRSQDARGRRSPSMSPSPGGVHRNDSRGTSPADPRFRARQVGSPPLPEQGEAQFGQPVYVNP